MIRITRLNGDELILNSDIIEYIEATPDTVITTTSGQTMIVREPLEEIVRRIRQYRRSLMMPDASEAVETPKS